MKQGIFLIVLFLFFLNIAAKDRNFFTPKDSIIKLPVVHYDEIVRDTITIIDRDTVQVRLNLYNTDRILKKLSDSIEESYSERELSIDYKINRQLIISKIFSKDDLTCLYKNSIEKDFLGRSLLFSARIKKIDKNHICISLSLCVPDTDYFDNLNINIDRKESYALVFENDNVNVP